VRPRPGAQLVVEYADDTRRYYPVAGRGWRIDATSRCIVIGLFPRTYVPLDAVRSFTVEEVGRP
jgi:hypothetical protein